MPVIDLSFVLVGTTIPLDHGYVLFSALCRVVPALHGDVSAGVHPIRGRQSAAGVLNLTDWSRLKIRLPSEGLAPYIALAGKEIELEGHHVRVGVPQVEGLVPAPNLASRLVTFRNALTPSALEEDVSARVGPSRDRRIPLFCTLGPPELARAAHTAGAPRERQEGRRLRAESERADRR